MESGSAESTLSGIVDVHLNDERMAWRMETSFRLGNLQVEIFYGVTALVVLLDRWLVPLVIMFSSLNCANCLTACLNMI